MRHVRQRLWVIALLVALAAAAAAPAAPVFVLTGKGYGHGIGLSQYGAQGFALHGWTAEEILEHYYQGAALSPGAPNDQVDVLLASGRSSLAVGSAGSFQLAGETLPAGTYTAAPLVGEVRVSGNGLTRTVASPALLAPGTEPLELGGLPYRGTLLLASSEDGDDLAALNTLSRQGYLRGVVPREMPASWEAEALKAQAVAARTYSLAGGGHCSWSAGAGFRAATLPRDGLAALMQAAAPVLCPDTRDQVYGGLSAETTATNDAVQATAGRRMTYAGANATTYFSSTSGGETAAIDEEWGGAPVPYLVSVDDPFDSISPHHAWGPGDAELDCAGTSPDCVFAAAEMRDALDLSASPSDLLVTARNSSSRVATLEATAGGGTAAFTGAEARAALHLRSTWFHVGVLSLAPSTATVTYGRPVTLSGLARRGGTSGWGTAHLERRRLGDAGWATLGPAIPSGSWTRQVTPGIATRYRIVSGNATGEARLVSVRTLVTLAAPRAPFTRLSGSVGPARGGITVTLKRRRGDGSWAVVARAPTTSAGRFSFSIARPGTYRARADAGAGFLAGWDTVVVPPA